MQVETHGNKPSFIVCPFWLGLLLLLAFGISGCAAHKAIRPGHDREHQSLTPVGKVTCRTGLLKLFGSYGWNNCVNETTSEAQNVTAKAPCDESLWTHVYHAPRLVVKSPCISVTGTLVDASHGRNKDGCRHEKDGDCHTWLRVDKGEESLLNAKNRSDQAGNLVIEPICRYRVTQTDALEACKDWKQDLVLPPPGSRVRVTGAYVLDTQHGHMELHPISKIEPLQPCCSASACSRDHHHAQKALDDKPDR